MKTKRVVVILLLLFILLVPASVALAAPPFDTVVTEGEEITNDVVLFEGDLEVENGATVKGDVIVFNGNAYVAGTIEGDLVLFNGDLEAADSADITGDCVLFNGTTEGEGASSLRCTDLRGLPNIIAPLAELPNLPRLAEMPGRVRPDINVRVPSPATRFFINLAEAAGRSLLLGFLAFVAASMLPEHLVQVEDAVRRKPVASGTVGLLTAVAVPSLVALLVPVSIILTFVCIGLLGFPLMLALILGLIAGGLLGWIAVGNMVGERLAGPLKLKNRTLPVTAALGTALLTFVIGLMGFGEGLVTVLVACVGLGATALTKFGTRPYPVEIVTNGPKVNAVLETLPAEELAELKNSEE